MPYMEHTIQVESLQVICWVCNRWYGQCTPYMEKHHTGSESSDSLLDVQQVVWTMCVVYEIHCTGGGYSDDWLGVQQTVWTIFIVSRNA